MLRPFKVEGTTLLYFFPLQVSLGSLVVPSLSDPLDCHDWSIIIIDASLLTSYMLPVLGHLRLSEIWPTLHYEGYRENGVSAMCVEGRDTEAMPAAAESTPATNSTGPPRKHLQCGTCTPNTASHRTTISHLTSQTEQQSHTSHLITLSSNFSYSHCNKSKE